jgi:hypothetical protein
VYSDNQWGNLGRLYEGEYASSYQIFYTPSKPPDEDDISNWSNPEGHRLSSSYCYRMWKEFPASGSYDNKTPSIALTVDSSNDEKSLEQLALIADRCVGLGSWTGTDNTNHGLDQGYHAAYGDGHVDWIPDEDGWLYDQNGGTGYYYYMRNAFYQFDNGEFPTE